MTKQNSKHKNKKVNNQLQNQIPKSQLKNKNNQRETLIKLTKSRMMPTKNKIHLSKFYEHL